MSGLSDIIRDSYTSYASSLSVYLYHFSKRSKKEFLQQLLVFNQKKDTAKLCFLKSYWNFQILPIMVVKYIHSSMLGEYQSHYDVVCNNDKDHGAF
jgi:hypothetical protein